MEYLWIFLCEIMIQIFKALSCHWTDFQKQYSKMFPRYHTLTYLKGGFEHQLLRYKLYDLVYISDQSFH